MLNNEVPDTTDSFLQSLIRRMARQLVGKAGFTREDCDDIEQDLRLELLKRREAFDPDRADWIVFVHVVLENCIANMLRDRRAAKRCCRRVLSLYAIVSYGNDGEVELSETLSEREDGSRPGYDRHCRADLPDLWLDVNEIIDSLPESLRDLCEQVKHDTVTQVADRMGIPRSTIQSRLRTLRKQFEQASLKDYT